MDRGDEQTDRFAETTEAILAFGPRLPGEGSAMAYMDTISDLVLLYRHGRSPTQPPLETARAVLAAAWQRLPHEVMDRLAFFGTTALCEGDAQEVPPPGLAEVVPAEADIGVLPNWRDWIGPQRESLLAFGLVACEREAAVDAAKPGLRLVLRGTCVGETVIKKDVVIVGVETERLGKPTLSGADKVRVTEIEQGVRVTLRALAITGGLAPRGAGIRNRGDLTLRDIQVQRNNNGLRVRTS